MTPRKPRQPGQPKDSTAASAADQREQRVGQIVARDQALVAEIARIAAERDQEMAALADKRAEGIAELVSLLDGNKAEAGRRLGWKSPTAHVNKFLTRLHSAPDEPTTG